MDLKWILMATLGFTSLGFGPNSSAQLDPHPKVAAAFPEIHDWNTLPITLSRSGCYGKCPTYEVEIHGDGAVLYDGRFNVAAKGKRIANISHTSLVERVDFFRKANYFSLSDRYVSGLTDNPTYTTSISLTECPNPSWTM